MSDRSEAGDRIQGAIRRLVARGVFVNDGVARRLGLRLIDLQVLNLMLLPDGPRTPSDIVAATGLPASTTTRVLDRLEAAGFLSRIPDPGDRRKVSLELDRERCADMDEQYRALRAANAARNAVYSTAELEIIARYLEEHVADPMPVKPR